MEKNADVKFANATQALQGAPAAPTTIPSGANPEPATSRPVAASAGTGLADPFFYGRGTRNLARSAGNYFALAEACGDPAQSEIKAQALAAFRSRLPEAETPDREEAIYNGSFDLAYQGSSNRIAPMLRNPDPDKMCYGADAGTFSVVEARKQYEIELAKW